MSFCLNLSLHRLHPSLSLISMCVCLRLCLCVFVYPSLSLSPSGGRCLSLPLCLSLFVSVMFCSTGVALSLTFGLNQFAAVSISVCVSIIAVYLILLSQLCMSVSFSVYCCLSLCASICRCSYLPLSAFVRLTRCVVVTTFYIFPGNMNDVEYEFCGPYRQNVQNLQILTLVAIGVVAGG